MNEANMGKKPFLTVITPTYNRNELLKNLYQSLLNQTYQEFEWMIVDDGSIDDTESAIRKILTEAPFKVSYYYKPNGGKHTALNVGIKKITTDLTIIVDSDDILLPDAIEKIKKSHVKYARKDGIGAYCFLRVFANGKPIVSLDQDEFINSYVKYRIKENRPGDMAEVFKTKVLQEYPFPEFQGERFLSEDVVWIQIGLKYNFAFINQPIYQCEYLEGGLTANDKPMKFSSLLGSMMRGKMLMYKECGIKANLKGAIIYNCYRYDVIGNIPNELKLKGIRNRLLITLTIPFGFFYNRKWKK